MGFSITSANSTFTISCPDLGVGVHNVQGFMADDAFTAEDVTTAEAVMGVDGILSAGWLPTAKPMTVALMPNSPSYTFFEQWMQASDASREIIRATTAVVVLPSVGKIYTLQNGFLTRGKPIPAAKKILQGTTWNITWNTITSAGI